MEVLEDIDRPAIERLRAAQRFFWLDLRDPDAEQLAALADAFDVHPLVVEDLRNFGQRPKVDDYAHLLHLVFYGLAGESPAEVHLLVTGDALVTVRRGRSPDLAAARRRIEALDPQREEYAVYRVLDTLTDTFFPEMERIDERIDALEGRVVTAADNSSLQEIMALRAHLADLRRKLGPQRDLMATAGGLFGQLPGFTGDGSHDYFRDVHDHLLRIADSLETFRDELAGLLDVYLSAQSNRLNAFVTRLTVLGSVFLPLTFLTGFFGQNFGWLVGRIGSAAAFWGAGVGLEVVAVVALLAWFRRAGLRQ